MQAVLRTLFLLAVFTLPVTAFSAAPALDIPRDSHGRIARSPAAKAAFKHLHPCPTTGLPHGRCPGYIIDHVIALKRGGPDIPANMQWQTVAEAKAKDRWE